MKLDRIEGQWKKLKGQIAQNWRDLVDEDAGHTEDRRDEWRRRSQLRGGVSSSADSRDEEGARAAKDAWSGHERARTPEGLMPESEARRHSSERASRR